MKTLIFISIICFLFACQKESINPKPVYKDINVQINSCTATIVGQGIYSSFLINIKGVSDSINVLIQAIFKGQFLDGCSSSKIIDCGISTTDTFQRSTLHVYMYAPSNSGKRIELPISFR